MELIALADRLAAKVSAAVGRFDRTGGWELDGATSMTAWLRHRARMSGRVAASTARTARRLRHLPHTAGAWSDGTLSEAQVQAVMANVDDGSTALFAEHEGALVPTLAQLSVRETALAMQAWRARADALADHDVGAEPRLTAYLSQTLDGRWELEASLDPEGGQVVATAMRLAASPDAEAEAARSPARRRGDALVDVCRFFLDHRRRTARPATVRTSTWSSTTTTWSRATPVAGRKGAWRGPPPFRRCFATQACTASSPKAARRCWTTAPPPAPSAPTCGPRWCCATGTAAIPAVTGPRHGARPITWCPCWTAAPPVSPTWCSSAADTTTLGTAPGGPRSSNPTAPSSSPTPRGGAGRRWHLASERWQRGGPWREQPDYGRRMPLDKELLAEMKQTKAEIDRLQVRLRDLVARLQESGATTQEITQALRE